MGKWRELLIGLLADLVITCAKRSRIGRRPVPGIELRIRTEQGVIVLQDSAGLHQIARYAAYPEDGNGWSELPVGTLKNHRSEGVYIEIRPIVYDPLTLESSVMHDGDTSAGRTPADG